MAYSTQRAVSDGTMTYLDLSISYQARADIKVFFNDLPAPAGTWAWVGTTDKRISFTPAVPNGTEVLVQRTTRIDRIINVFARGAKFNNSTMDENFLQVLYLTQEAVEGSALSDIYNDVDFHGYKIKNLGLAVEDKDAITFGQVKTMNQSAYQAMLDAQAARDIANASRDKAKQWATQLTTPVEGTDLSSKQYALNAGVSAAAALGSQNAAALSESHASDSEDAAAASAAAAAQSAQNAHDAALPADTLVADVADAKAKANAATAAVATAVQKAGDTMSGELKSTNTNQWRIKAGSYGVFWRFDGSNHYLMSTAANDQDGTYSARRPFVYNPSTGNVTLTDSAGGGQTTIGGGTATLLSSNTLSQFIFNANGFRPMLRSNSGAAAMEFINSPNTAANFTVYETGTVVARAEVQASGSRHAVDGNIYGTVWGGWLSNWLNTMLAGKQNVRNSGWANGGYVVTNSSNSMQIWWDGNPQMSVDSSYQGVLMHTGNFSNWAAQAGANCQWNSGASEYGPIGNGTVDVGAPQVVIGARTCGGSSTANCIWLRSVWIRNR
ncbi:tail fiber protein [Ralstonia phage RSB3]|uniref:Putative tail fiber protein n=1 Tax=Ralstonia phage RSB3 TaxID=1402875 RepID=U3TM45_9CAUD|nr:tail fiber protein [Ralstonia phage RSB3]BAN92354.1 putative tail fiber protein [Ralstonia phage RSB3]